MEFFGINGWEFVVLLLLALFIFGPDRLPKLIADGVKMLRNLRDLARNATGDLGRELGTDISLEDLNPKALIRKHILSEEDEAAIRQPLDALYRDVRSDLKGVRGGLDGVHKNIRDTVQEINPRKPVNPGGPIDRSPEVSAAQRYVFDDDAT
ncbi:MAG TPA: preprotein translocase subunit TatB [Micromonosporaceae bacterium]